MTAIPIVFEVAYPDYKRPSVAVFYHSVDSIDDAKSTLIWLFRRYFREDITSEFPMDYEAYAKELYQENYMDNSPFEYNIFHQGKWQQPWSIKELFKSAVKEWLEIDTTSDS